MEIIYQIKDFPDPGDNNLYNGIQEINKNNYQGALKHFEKASNYENEYASLFAAVLHFTGFGLNKRNPKKAIDLLQKIASNWNNLVAQYLLGVILCEGDEGIPSDYTSGIHWLSLAADNGWTDATLTLGHMHWLSADIYKDRKKANEYYEKVAKIEKDTSLSIYDSTLHLFGNKDFKVNFIKTTQKVVEKLKSKYRTKTTSLVKCVRITNAPGDTDGMELKNVLVWSELTNMKLNSIIEAQINLASTYRFGENLPKDHEKAMYWAKKAVKSRDASAFTLVALFYDDGVGVDQSYEEAMKWHKQSLILNESSESNYYIGKLYYFGRGVKKDHKLALDYFNLMLSYDNQYGEAFYFMGEIYEKGEDGIPLSYKKSFECYQKAFDRNCGLGASSIGLLYHNGLGVEKDVAKAYEWFAKSSMMNCPFGNSMLGIYYLRGLHVEKDNVKGLLLLNLAYKGGNEEAGELLSELFLLMSL